MTLADWWKQPARLELHKEIARLWAGIDLQQEEIRRLQDIIPHPEAREGSGYSELESESDPLT